MKKITTLVGAGMVILALTGCAAVPDEDYVPREPTPPATILFERPGPNGGMIDCIATIDSEDITCDWVGYFQEYSTESE